MKTSNNSSYQDLRFGNPLVASSSSARLTPEAIFQDRSCPVDPQRGSWAGGGLGEYYSEHENRTPVWPEVERIGLATGATVRLVLKAEFHTRCEPTAASSEHCRRILCRSLTRMGWPWVVPLITCVCSQSRINPVISSPRPRGASSATSRAITGSAMIASSTTPDRWRLCSSS